MEGSHASNGSIGIDVQAIEQELRDIWESLGKESEKQGQALMRTCVLNVVAVAPTDPGGKETIGTLGEVSSLHPSRLLILLPKTDSPQSSLHAMVTTQCHSAGSRSQVCCEQIVVSASGKGVKGLASAVRPLLVPDLPVVLYWRHQADFRSRIFLDLALTADRVIVDSRRFRDSARGFQDLRGAIEELPGASFSDLTWTQMNPWRRLVSGFYNIPDCRSWLGDLRNVQIECARSRRGQTGLPVQALLMAAWLSSRLEWKPQGHFEWISDDSCRMELKAGGHRVTVTVRLLGGGEGLERIQLQSNTPGITFNVYLDQAREHLCSDIVASSKTRNARVSLLKTPSEAYLIARELEILSRDQVFEQAARMAAELAN